MNAPSLIPFGDVYQSEKQIHFSLAISAGIRPLDPPARVRGGLWAGDSLQHRLGASS